MLSINESHVLKNHIQDLTFSGYHLYMLVFHQNNYLDLFYSSENTPFMVLAKQFYDDLRLLVRNSKCVARNFMWLCIEVFLLI